MSWPQCTVSAHLKARHLKRNSLKVKKECGNKVHFRISGVMKEVYMELETKKWRVWLSVVVSDETTTRGGAFATVDTKECLWLNDQIV